MKTRSYRELFQLMIDSHRLFEDCLCLLICHMVDNNIINKDEWNKLDNYIDFHRPKEGEKHYDPFQKDSVYYWKEDEWPPRLAWLLDQIKKCS